MIRFLALVTLSCGFSWLPAATDPDPERPELQLVASSERIRVWDCLLLKYVIRNDTSADVQLTYPTDFKLGKVTIEHRREPDQTWYPYKSNLSKVLEGTPSVGPAPKVEKGTTHVGIADLFVDEKGQPVFATPGVYYLRVCIPFRKYGVLKSEAIRVEVTDTPADQKQFIEQDRETLASALYAGLVFGDKLEDMYQIEGRLSHCQIRSLLRCQILILEQFRKRGFRVDDDCKRLLARLRKERGDILTDFCTLYCAEHFNTRRQWIDARELLNTLPEHSCQRDMLLTNVQLELTWELMRIKK